MAKLEKPILPPFFYRYRKISAGQLGQEIKAIREQYLWCAPYKDMNDPMEGFYQPSVRFQKQTDFMKAAQRIFDAKQTIGMCCFSDTHDNELMWTHYSENYSGICVGYRPRFLLNGLPPDVQLVRLGYGNVPPEVGIHDTDSPAAAARKILSHKKSSWTYEREWRVFGPCGAVPFVGRCVAELRLGSRVSDADKQKILSNFADSKIRIYQMVVDAYTHRWKRLNSRGKAGKP